jgi:hypothetical protein
LTDDNLRIRLDGGGSTLIRNTGTVAADLENAMLQVDTASGFYGNVGQTYDVLWSDAGISTNGLALKNISSNAQFNWNVVEKDQGYVLQLTLTSYPSAQTIEIGFEREP